VAEIALESLTKVYPDGTHAVTELDLDVASGEFVVFVGPSGCGKSTLLRLVAGLEDITGGRMLFDGDEVNDLPPAERGIAMVFQSYALYPHMSVYDNMAFGLKLANVGKEGVDERVRNAARILQIEHLLERTFRDELVGQLVPARSHLAAYEAVLAEPVLADPVEPRRVDVNRDGGLAHLVPNAMDVPRPALACVARSELELDVRAAVHEEILANATLRAAQADTGDVVVVEPGSLPGHPGEHPGVELLVLVDQLVATLLRVGSDERLPDVASFEDVDRELLELAGRQKAVVRPEITEGR